MKKYIVFAILSPIFMILEVLGDVIIPYLMSGIVDVVIVNQDIDYIVKTGIIMILAALFAMFFLVAWTVGYYAKLEQSHIQNLIDYANIDGLTGAFNHRYFYDTIERLVEDSKNNNAQLSLLMMDIDYFKKYNDIYGHSPRDELLKEITTIIRNTLKEIDFL